MIEGVQVIPLRRIPDERGTIFHMLRSTDPHFQFNQETLRFVECTNNLVGIYNRYACIQLNISCGYCSLTIDIND